jgi:hypothetical protein
LKRWLAGFGLAAVVGGAVSCRPSAGSVEKRPTGVVDSIVPREVALQRFRHGLTPAESLSGGSTSRDKLVKRFMSALAQRDTAALAGMAISREEFAYLYHPTSPQSLPPYELEPALMWQTLFERSDRGIRRALHRYGGQRLRVLGYDCGSGSSREGENTIWGPCIVRFARPGGDTASVRLFSQIIGRNGHYKFLSYANKL